MQFLLVIWSRIYWDNPVCTQ